MPKLTNIKTGREYTVTAEELKQMQQKPNIMKAFKVHTAAVPDVVQQAMRKQAETKTA